MEKKKSEVEPLKVWGHIEKQRDSSKQFPKITTQCLRVPASDGHMAAVFVNFEKKPTKEQILECWKNYSGRPQELSLPIAPKQFLNFFTEENRPQTKLDRNLE